MAIFQDQPISLQAIQGVNPEAFVQRAEREQQANAQQFQAIQQGIYQGIQNFENKRQEKQQKTASIEMLKQLGVVEGLSDKAIEAGIDEVGAANFLKTLQGLEASSANMERAREAAQQAGRTASQENYEYLIRQGVPPEQAREQAFGKGGGTTVNVGGDKSEGIGEKYFYDLVDDDTKVLNDRITPIVNAQPFVERMETLLNATGEEKIITGQFATPELFMKSVGAELGFDFPDVSTTKEYIATAGRQVGEVIKLFGSGTGLSDADRTYADRIAGGDINIPLDALKRIVAEAKKVSQMQLDNYNSRIERLYNTESGMSPGQVILARRRLAIPGGGFVRENNGNVSTSTSSEGTNEDNTGDGNEESLDELMERYGQ